MDMLMSDKTKMQTVRATAGDRKGRAIRALPIGPFSFEPKRPVDTQVYEHLRRIVASGAVAPGQKFSTRALAEAFSLSATPTRVALKRLAAEGVLVGRPRSGFQVAPASAAAYRELLAIRLRLEGLAAKEAATRIVPASLRAVETFHRMIAARPPTNASYLELNFALHFEIYHAAEMPRLLDIIEPLWARIGPFLNHAAKLQDFDVAVANHQRIIDA
ncbi:MAG: GntR family transcriptional regulator, partial [Pseudorhodoplanes sp.]|nr:GntR family transcriptional regulator [Pseudorhodoplanes sp.]